MYLLAIILPPVAVLCCGKPVQAILNCLLTLCFYVPGMIHAIVVVSSYKADRRTKQITRAGLAQAGIVAKAVQPAPRPQQTVYVGVQQQPVPQQPTAQPPPQQGVLASAPPQQLPPAATNAPTVRVEVCENCGRSIGRLEQPFLHNEHVVCRECYQRLRSEGSRGQ